MLFVYTRVLGMKNYLKSMLKVQYLLSKKYEGKILVRGGKKLSIEGKESPRTVVIEFPSFNAAKNYYYSKEYQKAHSFLEGTVVRDLQIVEGP